MVLYTLDGLPFVARPLKGSDAATAVSDAARPCGFEPMDAISPPIVAEACFSPQRAAPTHMQQYVARGGWLRVMPSRSRCGASGHCAFGMALNGGTDGCAAVVGRTRTGRLAVLSDEQSVLTVVQDGEHLVFCCQAGGGKLLQVWLEPDAKPYTGRLQRCQRFRVRRLMRQGTRGLARHAASYICGHVASG